MAAKKKTIEEKTPAECKAESEVISLHLPAGKQPGRIVGSDASAVPELVRLLKEEAKVI
jgi:electron transfer flavoprotein beta subunit